MRIDLERPTMRALETQASQHAVWTGTSMYSNPAASAAATTLSNNASEGATWALAKPYAVVSPHVGRNQPNSSLRMARLSPERARGAIGAGRDACSTAPSARLSQG